MSRSGQYAFPHFLYILSHKKEKKSNKNKKPNDFNYLENGLFLGFVTMKKPNDFNYLSNIAKNRMISTTYGK